MATRSTTGASNIVGPEEREPVQIYRISEDGFVANIESDAAVSHRMVAWLASASIVDQTGTICVTRIGSVVFVTFHDRLVSRQALIAARILVRQLNCEAVEITTTAGGRPVWQSPSMSPKQAVSCIDARLHHIFNEGPRFYQTELPPEDLSNGSSLALVLTLWNLGQQTFDREFVYPILARLGITRHCCFTEDQASGRYLFDTYGGGLYDTNGWFANSSGRPLTTMPDSDYAEWTTTTYREIGQRGMPVLHRLSVDVRWTTSRVAKRDYYRLAIPHTSPDGLPSIFVIMSDVDF